MENHGPFARNISRFFGIWTACLPYFRSLVCCKHLHPLQAICTIMHRWPYSILFVAVCIRPNASRDIYHFTIFASYFQFHLSVARTNIRDCVAGHQVSRVLCVLRGALHFRALLNSVQYAMKRMEMIFCANFIQETCLIADGTNFRIVKMIGKRTCRTSIKPHSICPWS